MKRSGHGDSAGAKKMARGDSEDGTVPLSGNTQSQGGASQSSFEEELMMMDEGFGDQVIDLEEEDEEVRVRRWSRPEIESFDIKTTALAFHWVDIDMTSGQPLTANPCAGEPVIGSQEAIVPVVRMYGSTRDGASVVAYIHGFTPYFYVALPHSTDLSKDSLSQIRLALDQKVSLSIHHVHQGFTIHV